MRVYVVRKWPLRGRSRFACWNITRWLLCNVHFVQSTQSTIVTRPRRAKGTDFCSSEGYRCVRCVPCHLWCTHLTSLVVKKETFFSFPVAVNNSTNLQTPNVNYSWRTAPLTSKVAFYIFIQQIYMPNILNMVYTLRFFSLQNAVCFIILTCLVPVLFTFYIRDVLKLKKNNNSGVKRLR